MRSMLLIVVGCLPLATLTAASVVRWAALARRPAAAEAAIPADLDRLVKDLGAVARQRDEMARLAEADLWAADLSPPADAIGPDSVLGGLGHAWSRWARAREMAAAWAALPHATPEAVPPEPAALRAWQEFSSRFTPSPDGGQPLIALAGSRLAAMAAGRDRGGPPASAEALVEQARAAFAAGRMDQTVRLCEQWLGRYASRSEAGIVDKVDLLRRRAAFRQAADELDRRLETAGAAQRRTLVEQFLREYGHPRQPTASEEQTLKRLRAGHAGSP